MEATDFSEYEQWQRDNQAAIVGWVAEYDMPAAGFKTVTFSLSNKTKTTFVVKDERKKTYQWITQKQST